MEWDERLGHFVAPFKKRGRYVLYYLLYPLHTEFIGFNVFRYITFRMLMALFTAMIIYLVFGRPFIRLLSRFQFLQAIRDCGPSTHLEKIGTPTMGGVLIWISVLISSFLWTKFDEPLVYIGLSVIVCFSLIGFLDDYLKVILKNPKGLAGRWKLVLQVGFSLIAAIIVFQFIGLSTTMSVPFFKLFRPDLGNYYIPFFVLVMVGASNAINITDGLDGLVTVPAIVSFFAYAVFAYFVGHAHIAGYLGIEYVTGSGELAIVSCAVIGASIGFLWFNTHPASIFMGDVGSLPLGALLGYIAIITKQEILLVLIGGVFVVEALSVMMQVASFKLTGKRIFKMAPLHHHFELKGWAEPKVIVRFWIVSIVLALLSLMTLKLR